MSQPLPPKKEVALALLERSSVHVHLDPRGTTAVVPPWFKRQPQLVLQIGLNMEVPIPDLRLDDAGLSCTLSFNRSPFFCVVPWATVFAMVGDDGRGMVWPDEVPPEIAKQPPPPKQTELAVAPPPPVETRTPGPTRRAATKRASGASARSAGATAQSSPAPAVEGARDEKSEKLEKDKAAKAPKKSRKKRPAAAAPTAKAAAAIPSPEPELRRVLVAVPPAAPSSPSAPSAARHEGPDRRAPAPAPARSSSSEAEKKPAPIRPSQPHSDPRRAPGKPKRELPPYLRVVK